MLVNTVNSQLLNEKILMMFAKFFLRKLREQRVKKSGFYTDPAYQNITKPRHYLLLTCQNIKFKVLLEVNYSASSQCL